MGKTPLAETKAAAPEKSTKIKTDLDMLFKAKKGKKKAESKKAEVQKPTKEVKKEKKEKSKEKKRKFTAEGYPIYSVDELNIGKGADTPDCPFDCNCCF